MAVSQNVKHGVTTWSTNSIPKYIPKRIENRVQTKTYINVYSSIIYDSEKVEITQMILNWWISKCILINVIEPCNGLLLVNAKKWYTHYTDEPWKHST